MKNEEDKLNKEKQELKEEEAKKREADNKYRFKINTEISQDLIEKVLDCDNFVGTLGLNSEQITDLINRIIEVIKKGKIRHLQINY